MGGEPFKAGAVGNLGVFQRNSRTLQHPSLRLFVITSPRPVAAGDRAEVLVQTKRESVISLVQSAQQENQDTAAVAAIEESSSGLGMFFMVLYHLANDRIGFDKPSLAQRMSSAVAALTGIEMRRVLLLEDLAKCLGRRCRCFPVRWIDVRKGGVKRTVSQVLTDHECVGSGYCREPVEYCNRTHNIRH